MIKMRYDRIPEHMRGGARRYIEQGIMPGIFLTAILENDFAYAVSWADETDKYALLDYATWLIMDLPMSAWGSTEVVRDWVKSGGFEGQAATRWTKERERLEQDAISSK